MKMQFFFVGILALTTNIGCSTASKVERFPTAESNLKSSPGTYKCYADLNTHKTFVTGYTAQIDKRQLRDVDYFLTINDVYEAEFIRVISGYEVDGTGMFDTVVAAHGPIGKAGVFTRSDSKDNPYEYQVSQHLKYKKESLEANVDQYRTTVRFSRPGDQLSSGHVSTYSCFLMGDARAKAGMWK